VGSLAPRQKKRDSRVSPRQSAVIILGEVTADAIRQEARLSRLYRHEFTSSSGAVLRNKFSARFNERCCSSRSAVGFGPDVLQGNK